MNIYEKIFARLDELHMSQIELSRRTGIATSTIIELAKKKPKTPRTILRSKKLIKEVDTIVFILPYSLAPK